MHKLVCLAALSFTSCATVRDFPLHPHTCESEGGINLSNARLLQIENFDSALSRGSIFDRRRSVEIGGDHYSFDSFRPILMCIDPGLSADIPALSDAADEEIWRRYSLMSATAILVPALPIAAATTAVALGISGSVAGIVGYLHKKLFESNGDKLKTQTQSYNRKVAATVRKSMGVSRMAKFDEDQEQTN